MDGKIGIYKKAPCILAKRDGGFDNFVKLARAMQDDDEASAESANLDINNHDLLRRLSRLPAAADTSTDGGTYMSIAQGKKAAQEQKHKEDLETHE